MRSFGTRGFAFWAEPDVVAAYDAHITIGGGEIDGGSADGTELIALVIHHGEDNWGRAYLTPDQAQRVIDSLAAARAAFPNAQGGPA